MTSSLIGGVVEAFHIPVTPETCFGKPLRSEFERPIDPQPPQVIVAAIAVMFANVLLSGRMANVIDTTDIRGEL